VSAGGIQNLGLEISSLDYISFSFTFIVQLFNCIIFNSLYKTLSHPWLLHGGVLDVLVSNQSRFSTLYFVSKPIG
jgi:hypothetical protein